MSESPLTVREVADIFGVDPATVKRWADTGKLPHFRTLGGHRRFDPIEVEQYRAAQRREATIEPGAVA